MDLLCAVSSFGSNEDGSSLRLRCIRLGSFVPSESAFFISSKLVMSEKFVHEIHVPHVACSNVSVSVAHTHTGAGRVCQTRSIYALFSKKPWLCASI